MTFSTSGIAGESTVNLETIASAMRDLAAMPKSDHWFLIDPQGRSYQGSVEDVTRVLLAHHPLLHPPKFPRDYFNEQEK